ncbi:MAG: DUF4135 domain-containing protein [Methylobacter sp.]|nr:DUF4135 domain-containing protein [Methylobacter sp.]
MQNLLKSTRNPQEAFERVIAGNRSLQQALDNEIRYFIATTTLTAQRLAHDMPAITAIFTKNHASLQGVTHWQIAGQFAFNGGQRIVIVTLACGQKIVYKPRDLRIEAKLVGHIAGAEPSFIELFNNLLAETLGTAVTPIPTYPFFPCQDAQGYYGYVGYLSCGTEQDNVLSDAQAQILYRQLGQLTGISLLLGLYDLLPCNIRISGKQAYLADADIAFEPLVLRTFLQELDDNATITVPPASLERSLLSSFWQNSLNTIRSTTRYAVRHNQLVNNSRLKEPDSRLHEVALENMVIVTGKGSNRHLNKTHTPPQNIHRLYAAEIKQGIQDIFVTVRTHPHASSLILAFIDSLQGFAVRYFPFLLLSATVQKIYLNYIHDCPEPDALASAVQDKITRVINKKNRSTSHCISEQHTQLLKTAIYHSVMNGDYFYITRHLGEATIYYQGKPLLNDIMTCDEREAFSQPCPLQLAKAIVIKLADQGSAVQTQQFADCYARYILSLTMPRIPPAYALHKLVNILGEPFAQQLGYIPETHS